jgi:hypothetical protein
MSLLDRKTELIKQMNIQTFDKKGKQLDAFFIGNKFVMLNNERSQSYSLHLNIRRMQKLVLLTEIYYMQIHKEALIEQDWEDYKYINGLSCRHLYPYNAYNTGEIMLTHKIWYPPYYKITQKEYEAKIDKRLNEELDLIVKEIYNITEFIDSVDLIKILRADFPEGICVPENYAGFGGDFPIDKALIYEKFQNFDFGKLRELNELEREKLQNSDLGKRLGFKKPEKEKFDLKV